MTAKQLKTIEKEIAKLEDIGYKDWNLRLVQEEKIEKLLREVEPKNKTLATGHEISFRRGDGYARYLVTEVQGDCVLLLHIPTGDAWHATDCVFHDDIDDAIWTYKNIAEHNISSKQRFIFLQEKKNDRRKQEITTG